ncbi:MAG TPA: gluconate 2-dehydrogenase subunit 3 family protein [Candidatus Didemnitutus sp.]|nr:gluconate 2-dehydrogenase subunit 3 family protein [Candidatus Didemnitutus sp.]
MDSLPRIDRRTALKWMAAASAALVLAAQRIPGMESAPAAKPYGTDPDLIKGYKPGELWPLTFTDAQRLTAAALCDTIIPADGDSPSASKVGVVDFLDEWISAPYEDQRKDRDKVLEGLAWIDDEATKRFGKKFAALADEQKHAICDDICYTKMAKPEFKKAAHFFGTFRNLTAGGFYTTPEGRKDLQYVGNIPLATFDGPPIEVLRKAGLA